jgi:hypothetical protein
VQSRFGSSLVQEAKAELILAFRDAVLAAETDMPGRRAASEKLVASTNLAKTDGTLSSSMSFPILSFPILEI